MDEKEGCISRCPSSSAINLIYEILIAGVYVAALPARKSLVSNGIKIEVEYWEKRRKIKMNSEKNMIEVLIDDIDAFKGTNKGAKKLFVLIMEKAAEQVFYNGRLRRDYVSFPMKEFIERMGYASTTTARRSFFTSLNTLQNIRICGTSKKKEVIGSGESIKGDFQKLFPGGEVTQSQCIIYLNPNADWSLLTPYAMVMPKYFYRLSNRGADLLFYIFYMARQRLNPIKNDGGFVIGFRAIQQRLFLASEKNNDKPLQSIKKPIFEAVEEINQMHRKEFGNEDLKLSLIYTENAKIRDFLDCGNLKIELSGDLKDNVLTAKALLQKKNDDVAMGDPWW